MEKSLVDAQIELNHRLYGHDAFVKEAIRQNKGYVWVGNICNGVGCKEFRW